MNPIPVLRAACLAGLIWTSALAPAQDVQGEWIPLFNGVNLDGWVQRNGQAQYRVEDNAIVGETVVNTPNSFLCTEKSYGDFVLELEFLVDERMNSGIQIRSHSYANYQNGHVHGYQIEIDPASRIRSGGIYDEARRGWLDNLDGNEAAQNAFKHGEWNRYRIQAIGGSLKTWVNGVPAAAVHDTMTHTGLIALQVHSTTDPNPMTIRWRNIRILDLDDHVPSADALNPLFGWYEGSRTVKGQPGIYAAIAPLPDGQMQAVILPDLALQSPPLTILYGTQEGDTAIFKNDEWTITLRNGQMDGEYRGASPFQFGMHPFRP